MFLFLRITSVICASALLLAFLADLAFHLAVMKMGGGIGIFARPMGWLVSIFISGNVAIALGCWVGHRLHVFPFP
jgi:hypothetical protein